MMVNRLFLSILFTFVFLLVSCRSDNKLLEKEDLFIIPMGVAADELDYFYRGSSLLPGTSDLYIQNGRIFVSSSHAGKVVEMNSYGDLLSLIYNPQTNPEPAHYQKSGSSGKDSLLRIRKWNFRNIEHIAISDRGLYVVDQVDDTMVSKSDQFLYNRILLRFDEEGEYLDSLGQEGINGTPFPYINDLQITEKDDLVVITQSTGDFIVFWFSPEGSLLYKIIVKKSDLPKVQEGSWGLGQVEKITADPAESKLYLKIAYFPLDDTRDRTALSRLYTLDLEKEEYTNFFEIPHFEVNMGDQAIEGVNEYLGAISGGFHFFLGSDYNGKYHLTIMDSTGAVKTTRVLNIQDQDIIYKKLYLAPSGLLAGIFYEEGGARISWWRADRIAEKYAEK